MSDNVYFQDELSKAIANRYVELESLVPELGSVENVIRADYESRYGAEGLDAVIDGFKDELDAFDRRVEVALATPDYIKTNLEGIMNERGMSREQRVSFLSSVKQYEEASGTAQLARALSGNDEVELQRLISRAPANDGADADPDALLKDVLDMAAAASVAPDAEQIKGSIDDVKEAADSPEGKKAAVKLSSEDQSERDAALLRCYAAYVALRDDEVPGVKLAGDGKSLIADNVRAGQKRAKVMRGLADGSIDTNEALEVLRSVSDVLLVSTSIVLSVAVGATAAISVMVLIQVLTGFNGGLLGIMIAIELIAGAFVGVKATGAALEAFAEIGDWLEDNVMEPGFESLARHIDGLGKWIDSTARPATEQAWNGLTKYAGQAWEYISKGAGATMDAITRGVQPAFANAGAGISNAANTTADWLEKNVQPAAQRAADSFAEQARATSDKVNKWIGENQGDFDKAINDAADSVGRAITSVVDWLAGHQGKIDEAIDDAAAKAHDVAAEGADALNRNRPEIDKALDSAASHTVAALHKVDEAAEKWTESICDATKDVKKSVWEATKPCECDADGDKGDACECGNDNINDKADACNCGSDNINDKCECGGDDINDKADACNCGSDNINDKCECGGDNINDKADACNCGSDNINSKCDTIGDADTVKPAAPSLDDIEPQIEKALNTAAEKAEQTAEHASEWVKQNRPEISEGIDNAVKGVTEGVKRAGDWVRENRPELDKAMNDAAQNVRGAADTVVDWAKQNKPQLEEMAGKGAKLVQDAGAAAISWLQKQSEQLNGSLGKMFDSTPTTRDEQPPHDDSTPGSTPRE